MIEVDYDVFLAVAHNDEETAFLILHRDATLAIVHRTMGFEGSYLSAIADKRRYSRVATSTTLVVIWACSDSTFLHGLFHHLDPSTTLTVGLSSKHRVRIGDEDSGAGCSVELQ